jgi:hypothetical protein
MNRNSHGPWVLAEHHAPRLKRNVRQTWALWPVAAFMLDTVIRLMTSNSRSCSFEGCDFTPNVIELLFYFAPPVLATGVWWRWRRTRITNAG